MHCAVHVHCAITATFGSYVIVLVSFLISKNKDPGQSDTYTENS
jgi:hypothetical protein